MQIANNNFLINKNNNLYENKTITNTSLQTQKKDVNTDNLALNISNTKK